MMAPSHFHNTSINCRFPKSEFQKTTPEIQQATEQPMQYHWSAHSVFSKSTRTFDIL